MPTAFVVVVIVCWWGIGLVFLEDLTTKKGRKVDSYHPSIIVLGLFGPFTRYVLTYIFVLRDRSAKVVE